MRVEYSYVKFYQEVTKRSPGREMFFDYILFIFPTKEFLPIGGDASSQRGSYRIANEDFACKESDPKTSRMLGGR